MRISLKRLGILMGIFYVFLFALLSVICWQAGLAQYVAFLKYSTLLPLMVLGLAAACWWWRQKNGPYLDFLKALQFFFVAYLIYEAGYALVTILLYDILDKTLYYRALEFSLSQQRAELLLKHLPDVQIKDALENAAKDRDQGVTVKQLILGFGQNLLLDFVKSLVLSVVLQKKPPVEGAQ
jgi:hypothetical protein